MSFSARSPKVLPIIRDPNLAVWQNALTPILKKALPPATPTNFQATNVRGGIQISWSPLQRNDIGKPGPDGYEILRSVDGSFTGDVQIIPVKNAQQTNYFDPFGSATTAHYRIRATAGSASSPQAQRGPESGTVRHTSLDPSDSKSFSTTVRDNFTTDKTASNARFGNYGLDVYQNNPAVNGPASSSSASGGVSVPTLPSGGPPPSSGAVNFSSIIAGTNSGQLMVVGDGSEITTTGTGINDANSMNSIPVNAPAPADQQALTYVAANSDWEPVNLPISEPAVTHNFLTSYTSGTGVFTQAQPAFTDISGTVAPTQLPTPTATTLGGIESLAAVTSKWINTISTSGVPSATQPAFTDISGTAAVGQIPSLPASQITTGQLALARGGTNADLSATGGTHSFLKQASAGAAVTVVQPAFTDISGSVAATQLPNPTATTLGGVESLAPVAHNFLTSISTSGVPAQAQPAFTDISGTATSGQYVAMVGDSGSGGTQGAVPAPAAGTAAAGKFLKADGTWAVPGGGSGTVTSVGLGADSGAILVASGTPVTTTGVLQLQFSTEAANSVLAGPVSGSAATPTFRALTAADIPSAAGITSPATAGFREDVLSGYLFETAILTTPLAIGLDTEWIAVSIAGTNQILSSAGTFLNPGQLTFNTGSAASGNGIMLAKGGDSAATGASLASLGALGSNAGWELHFIIKLVQTTTCAIRFGVCSAGQNIVSPPSDGIWVEYDTANASSNTDFTYVTSAASTETFTTTNAIAADTSFHHFRIRSTVAGTIGFTVDGGTETNVTAHVTALALGVFIQMLTRTTALKSCTLDFVSYSASTGRT